MAFEGLADKISNAFKKLKSKGKLSENDVKGAMREVRLALLEADVNYKVAKDFTNKVTERAIGQDGRRKRKTQLQLKASDRHYDVRSAGLR